MIAQLDPDAGAILKKTMEGMGVKVLCEKITTHIVSEGGRVTHLLLKDGSRLETDMVVVSAGIRPITEIATASGLTVDKAIVTDDQMRTSDPDVFSLGECVQHRGKIYGLVDPIWEKAAVLADVLTGKNPKAAYLGSRLGTKLKPFVPVEQIKLVTESGAPIALIEMPTGRLQAEALAKRISGRLYHGRSLSAWVPVMDW
jgi:nitrite reductase (NADH) large subunit